MRDVTQADGVDAAVRAESNDSAARRGADAALRYLEGRELPARLDWASIRRLQRLLTGGAR